MIENNPCSNCEKGTTGRCDLKANTDILLSWNDLMYCPIIRRTVQPLVNQKTGEVYPKGL